MADYPWTLDQAAEVRRLDDAGVRVSAYAEQLGMDLHVAYACRDWLCGGRWSPGLDAELTHLFGVGWDDARIGRFIKRPKKSVELRRWKLRLLRNQRRHPRTQKRSATAPVPVPAAVRELAACRAWG